MDNLFWYSSCVLKMNDFNIGYQVDKLPQAFQMNQEDVPVT